MQHDAADTIAMQKNLEIMRNVTAFSCLLTVCAVLMMFMSGCAGTGVSTATEDDIKSAVEKGLEARWDYQNSHGAYKLNSKETMSSLKKYYERSIDNELKYIGKYKDADFENADLGDAALGYINSLEKQQDLLSSDIKDYWTLKYDLKAYQWYGTKALKQLNDICGFEFSDDYQIEFDQMMNDSDAENMSDDPKQVTEAFTIESQTVENDNGSCQPTVTVKNNTDFAYDCYALVYRVKSEDGTVIESGLYDYIYKFEAGSEMKTIYSGPELKPGYIYEPYGYAVEETEDDEYVGDTMKLPEPVTIRITE